MPSLLNQGNIDSLKGNALCEILDYGSFYRYPTTCLCTVRCYKLLQQQIYITSIRRLIM